ncbi:hypothetical protein IQ249_08370 [Lusitaniella coriacea LEGE 07157]|uniref:Uncharacterized protein n=1 Tax=Lusitaniella coriacea LEGE 07157 TaxID=945747 RepID=A0A8J7J9Y2_9CYAN|nr:hypothetical protein [Lusitaniella coriacea]MBE9115905.1 hypothetical protein [Lusitaniella coriacea LEGE 07157]
MAYWVKINYERNIYFVDLNRIGSFSCASNGRLTFWLPESSIPIILNRQGNSEDYNKILNYINRIDAFAPSGYWFKFSYEGQEYWVDLNQISSFCYAKNKLTFWLPNSSLPIILTQNSDRESYNAIMDFAIQRTGQTPYE